MTSHVAVQWAVVGVVVIASAVYATWTLLPVALRRALAAAALRLPLPAPIAAKMRAHATSASSCGCSGCDRNVAAPPHGEQATVGAQPITFHRRSPG